MSNMWSIIIVNVFTVIGLFHSYARLNVARSSLAWLTVASPQKNAAAWSAAMIGASTVGGHCVRCCCLPWMESRCAVCCGAWWWLPDAGVPPRHRNSGSASRHAAANPTNPVIIAAAAAAAATAPPPLGQKSITWRAVPPNDRPNEFLAPICM